MTDKKIAFHDGIFLTRSPAPVFEFLTFIPGNCPMVAKFVYFLILLL